MSEKPGRPLRALSKATEVIGVLVTLLVLVLASLGLTALHLQKDLDSDVVYPHMVALDVLDQAQPLSGWTFSSAPCFVPDLSLLTALTALCGRSGIAFAVYSAAYFILLAFAAGGVLKAGGWRNGGAYWAGAMAILALVLSGYSLGHYKFLSWCCLPVSHGGALLCGLVFTAGVLGEDAAFPKRQVVGLTLLAFAATASDSLFLVQFAGPALAALWWHRKGVSARSWRTPAVMTAIALGVWLLVRVVFSELGWFHFSKVFRYAPWPSAIWESTVAWWRDFTGGICTQAPIFVIVAGAALALFLFRSLRHKRALTVWETWTVLCLAATWSMPLATCYWKNYQHGRYLLPFVVVPGLWLLGQIGALVAIRLRTWHWVVVTAILALVTVICIPKPLTSARFTWPTNPDDNALQAFLESRNLQDGFADYWNCHRFNLYKRGQTRLHALKADGRVLFWNNNAYGYFESGKIEGQWSPRTFHYIVTERLDENALLQKFGEPDERVSVGEREVWLYDRSARLTKAVSEELEERVR